MLLDQDPELMLVDEPVAGHDRCGNRTDGRSAGGNLPETTRWWWSSTTWSFVRNLDSVVTFLHEGSVLAEGSMDVSRTIRGSLKFIWGAERC